MKIGFLGAGNMARAIARGLVSRGLCRPEELSCVSGSGHGAALMAEQTGARVASSRETLLRDAELIVLAFKPQHLETLTAAETEGAAGKLVLSVLAGRTLASLKAAFPLAAAIVRVMPNTPAQIGRGVSTFCFLQEPSPQQLSVVESILSSLGAAYPVQEDQLDIATVVNGCGPAFYFRLIQLTGEIAQRHGLDQALAMELACETGLGSLELLKQSERDPQQLIDEVVSPNGVTHALLASLERNGFPELLRTAIDEAVRRSIELSRP